MPVVAETAAALRFFGDDLDPDALTARLGQPPSFRRTKGQVTRSPTTGREHAAKTGVWLLKAEPRIPGDLDAQITEILDGLTEDLTVWRELSIYSPDLSVGIFMVASNEGIVLSAESITLLAARGVSLSLDIYDPVKDEEGE